MVYSCENLPGVMGVSVVWDECWAIERCCLRRQSSGDNQRHSPKESHQHQLSKGCLCARWIKKTAASAKLELFPLTSTDM